MISNCCHASLEVKGNTTKYFVCTKCGKACDQSLETMSPEAQRIAIAEVCGFRKVHEIFYSRDRKVRWATPRRFFRPPNSDYGNKLHPNQHWGWADPEPWAGSAPDWGNVPDYLNDLNAMHEAEKVIPQRDRCLYHGKLIKSTGPDGIIDLVDDYGEWSTSESTSFFALIHATAAQRAEAFLRTLGKWVPGE